MKIIVFGTGGYYQKYKKILHQESIVCFLDNDKEKQGSFIDDIYIEAPENIYNYSFDCIMVAASDEVNILRQLELLSVDLSKVVCIDRVFKKYNYSVKYTANRKNFSKRVLLISHCLITSGAPIALLNLGIELMNRGYGVDLFSDINQNDGILQYKILESGINIELYWDLRDIDVAECDNNYDIIFVNTIALHEVIRKLSGLARPVVWWLHEDLDVYKDYNVQKIDLDDNIFVYPVGLRAKDAFYNCFRTDTNGELLYETVTKECRKIAHKRIICLVIGAFSERKGQRLLCDIAKNNIDKWKNKIEFQIVGSIDEEEKRQFEVQDYIIIRGFVSDEELDRLYGIADVLICPSKFDPMPATVTRAMQNSITCLVSDRVGQVQYITDKYDGLVFPYGNNEKLINIIDWIIKNESELSKIGMNGHKIYNDHFTKERFKESIDKLLEEVTC